MRRSVRNVVVHHPTPVGPLRTTLLSSVSAKIRMLARILHSPSSLKESEADAADASSSRRRRRQNPFHRTKRTLIVCDTCASCDLVRQYLSHAAVPYVSLDQQGDAEGQMMSSSALVSAEMWYNQAMRFNYDHRRVRVGVLSRSSLNYYTRTMNLSGVEQLVFFDLLVADTEQQRSEALFVRSIVQAMTHSHDPLQLYRLYVHDTLDEVLINERRKKGGEKQLTKSPTKSKKRGSSSKAGASPKAISTSSSSSQIAREGVMITVRDLDALSIHLSIHLNQRIEDRHKILPGKRERSVGRAKDHHQRCP